MTNSTPNENMKILFVQMWFKSVNFDLTSVVFWISRPHSTDSATHRKMTLSLADRCSKTQKIRILPMAGRDPESHRNEMIKVLSISAVGFSTFSCYINNKKNKDHLWSCCGKHTKKNNMSLCNKVASGKEIFSFSKSPEGLDMYQLSSHKHCMWYQ